MQAFLDREARGPRSVTQEVLAATHGAAEPRPLWASQASLPLSTTALAAGAIPTVARHSTIAARVEAYLRRNAASSSLAGVNAADSGRLDYWASSGGNPDSLRAGSYRSESYEHRASRRLPQAPTEKSSQGAVTGKDFVREHQQRLAALRSYLPSTSRPGRPGANDRFNSASQRSLHRPLGLRPSTDNTMDLSLRRPASGAAQ